MLLQLVIGITVIMIMSSIVALGLSSFLHQQALENGAGEVTALLGEARSRTLAADDGLSYGVHLEAHKAVLFSGDTYVPDADAERTVVFDRAVVIDPIMLEGGGDEILFEQETGNTEEYGTFVMRKVESTRGMQTLVVTQAGQVSSQ